VSLRLRLLAAFAYVLVLVLVALELPLSLNLSRRVDAEVRAQAAGEAHLVAASVSDSLDDPAELSRIVTLAATEVGGRVIVVDRDGVLLADSAGAAPGDSYASRPEIASVLSTGRPTQGERTSETLDEELLYTAVPVIHEASRVGAVRVTQSVEEIGGKVWRDILALAGVGLVALLLGLGLAWILAGSLSRPLRGLARTAERVAGGDLDARAEVVGSTEQREVATAFNDMTSRLGTAVAAQRDFVANASHQLRTPLTGLRLRLEAASAKASDPELQRDLAAAERETERLARLLSGLLTLAREGEPPALREPASLAATAEAALDRWTPAAEQSGHELAVSIEEDAFARITAEDAAIVLDNMIENALTYAPGGGTVTIAAGDAGQECFVAVLDEGPGFEPGEEERVIERFARGSAGRGAPGTGLGLSIVQTLARRWGGEVRIANRPEGGARVELRLAREALPTPNRTREKALPGGAYREGR
jgi:signal transduction histidine kinase